MIHDPDDNSLLPYDSDAFDPKAPQKPRPATLSAEFAYDGRGFSLAQFQEHVKAYDFGKVAPDFIVLHHTANPDTSYAPIGADPRTKWDRQEQGLSDDEIRMKRKRQLDGLRDYYKSLGWNAGPHLFIDDRFIWLFTPMNTVGIHAKWGNSFRAFQKLHYSVGMEVIGYYERTAWPPKVQALVGGALRALSARLGISLTYMYASGPKPGMKTLKDGTQVCAHPEYLKSGGLSSHRDYNKIACPGAAISEAFYTSVAQAGAAVPMPPVNVPEPLTKRYRVKHRYITQRKEDNGPPYVRELIPGEEILVDAWYGNNRVHLADGSGFADLADLEAI